MSTGMILFVAISVFLLLAIGLGFTIWEFHNTVDAPAKKKDSIPDGKKSEQEK
jgi:hypothetical protein